MSFSAKVKEELAIHTGGVGRHCLLAGLYALLNNNDVIKSKFGLDIISIYTENEYLAIHFSQMVKNAFNHMPEVFIRTNIKSRRKYYYILICDRVVISKLLKAISSPLIMNQDCCKRYYLKSVFISNASITNPDKNYHLEYVFSGEQSAETVQALLLGFELKSKMIVRKKNYVVYIKDGEKISENLGLISAHQNMLEFEGLRVFKTVSNDVNRQVNCETANMAKTAKAFVSLQEDIELIEERRGLGVLSKPLREIAELRLEYPNATLKEIGEMLKSPISKSGVNHRLRKISEIAEKLRREIYG